MTRDEIRAILISAVSEKLLVTVMINGVKYYTTNNTKDTINT